MDESMAFLSELNTPQLTACTYEGNVLLTACPGSGKTRTLIYRLAYLSLKSPNSYQLNIAITYTNRAANEINDRLDQLGIDLSSIWAGTIHQFCLKYIIKPYSLFADKLKHGYHIIDEYVQRSYINAICTELQIRPEYDIHVALKNPTVQKMYKQKLTENREIDFEMILEISYDLLKQNPFISQVIAGIIRSIHVDEYQDTHELQYQILACIAKERKDIQIFFVGDKNQAIYGGIGGVAKDKIQLDVAFNRSFVEMNLSGCYRSTQRIINYYSNFQIEKSDITSFARNAGANGIIKLNCNTTKSELCHEIAQIVQSELSSGTPEEEICILAPQWMLLFDFSTNLQKELPNVRFDAPGISPVKYNPLNPFYLIAQIVFTKAGTNSSRRKRIATEIISLLNEEYNIVLPANYINHDLLKCINSATRFPENGIRTLKESIANLLYRLEPKWMETEDIQKAYSDFIKQIEDRVENYKLGVDLQSFEKCFNERQGVVINTCHGVKGEEYQVVIAFGMLNGYLPNWDVIINGSSVARKRESEQLLFVVCSRAKNNLYLFSETGRFTKKGSSYSPTDELIRVAFQYDT